MFGHPIVDKFHELWTHPIPERFSELVSPEGRLKHPGMNDWLPGAEVPNYVRQILTALPDMVLPTVESWAANNDKIMVEWTAQATVLDTPVHWCGVNRFTIRGQRAIEVVSYFDMLPLWAAIDPQPQRGSFVEFLHQVRTQRQANRAPHTS